MKRRTSEGIDPNWVLSTGQTVRTGMLETMLLQHGFIPGQLTGGSHTKFTHPLLERPVTLVAGSDVIANQRSAAERCLEVREIELRQEQEIIASKVADIKHDFTEAANSGVVATLDNVPEEIEAEEVNGVAVLRSKSLLAVGDIAPLEMHSGALKDQCEALKERASKRLEELGRFNQEFETQTRFEENGTLVIEQPRYDLEAHFPPYDPNSPDQSVSLILKRFRALVSSYDFLFQERVGRYIDIYQKDNAANQQTLPNKDIQWTLGSDEFSKIRTYELTTSPQGRMAPKDFFDLVDRATTWDLGGKRTSRALAEHLRMGWGCEVRRPKAPGEKKKLGDKVVVTHPFFPEWEGMELPVLDDIPLLGSLWKGFSDASSSVDEMDAWNRLEEIKLAVDGLYEKLWQGAHEVGAHFDKSLDAWNRVTGHLQSRMLIEVDKNITLSRLGKVINAKLFIRDAGGNKYPGDRGLDVKALFRERVQGANVDPKNLEDAREYIASLGLG